MTYTQILSDARRLSITDANSYPTDEVTDSANRALERVTGLIRTAQGRWQWDDSNNSDFSIATASLVAEQQDYELDPTHYRIARIEVKNEDDQWIKLDPFDEHDIYDQSLTDFLKTSGVPKFYDKIGNSVFLYPRPSYSQASSIKVYYERGAVYFETTDTTKTPGFNPLFHRLIPLWAAYDYAFINQINVAKSLMELIMTMEEQLIEYYSQRDRDEHLQIRFKRPTLFN